MNFQKLELQGFKSFADKTEISFKEGITVIVGPNGCGKSNVADSIRWVLGEQRPSTMRGQNMTDVIFNGTEMRRSLSYAEVSLFFDNRARIFPIDFDDVVLSRKIDRSGVGEYYINHGKCRLKDIIGLLHDTGIGREGYSIIGQGRVDQIIHAKPSDRRAIFEEAAGIASFKAKKIETERKLERANESLSRVRDILHEIEVRLSPLQKQAQNAMKYNELFEELKSTEINYFIFRYETNKEVVDAITERLSKVILETVEAEGKYRENEDKYEELKEKVIKIDDEISSLNEELLRLKVDLEHVAGEGKVYAERAISTANEIARLEKDEKNFTSDLETKSATLVDKVTAKEQKTLQLDKLVAEMTQSQKELDLINEKLSSSESDIGEANKRLILSVEELANIKSNLGKYVAERDLNAKRLEVLKNTVKDKKLLLDKEYTNKTILEANIVKLKNERAQLEIHHNECLEELKDKRESLVVFNEDKSKLNSRISALDTRYQMNVQMKENYDSYGRAVKLLMNDFKVNPELAKRSQGLIAELINVPEGMEAAFDTAFGNGLQNIVTNDEDDARYIIDFLKRKGYGKITFQPISVIRGQYPDASLKVVEKEHGVIGFAADLLTYDKKIDGIVRGMLGKNTIVVNNIDTAIRISKTYPYTYKSVTLDGDIIIPQGAITGGSAKPDTANILAKDREINAIKENLDKARRDYEKLMRLCVEAENDIVETEKDLREGDIKLSGVVAQLLVSDEKFNKAAEALENLEAEVQEQANEISELTYAIKDTEEKLALADKLEGDVIKQRLTADELAEKSRSTADTTKQEQASLSSKIVGLRVNIAELKADMDQTDIDISRLKVECQEISNTLLDIQAYLATNRANLKNIEAVSSKRAVTDADRVKIGVLEEKLQTFRKEKADAQEIVSEIDRLRDGLNKQINELKEKRYKEENKLEQTNSEIKYLHDHIWEEYELTYQSAVEFRVEEFDTKSAQQNISRLKRSINQLGDINPHAIEEYKEVSERFERETAQCEDLEKGKQDLIKIIEDLTNEMTTRFNDAFVQINENFQTAFRDLFGGGRGKLEIVDSNPESPLDAGVEIYAQPPGKKLAHITLLSGGEKTLTAIAILFAIIKMRPMPFCVLDEIDTALDDANAGLLAQYLKRFSEKTQFIVISHRKPTMEISDNIFGVSMEEKGVSTLLSVNLADALKFVNEEN